MTDISRKEATRLEDINDALNWRYSHSIIDLFNKTARSQQFIDAPTYEEVREQKALLRDVLSFNVKKSAVASAKATDYFLRAALRVGTAEELSSVMPDKAKFTQEDVAILEKAGCPSYAEVVKKRLEISKG